MYYYYPHDPYAYMSQYHYVPPQTIQDEIALGRQFHYFRTTIRNRGMVTAQLLVYNNMTGMATLRIVETGETTQVHFSDLIGWTYLGPQTPPTPPSPTPGKPPWCTLFPWHPLCK